MGTTFRLNVENTETDASYLNFPLWNYHGYKAQAENEKLEIIDGENKNVCVIIPAGYAGEVKVSFHSPWYWRVADMLSLLTAVCCFVLYRKKAELRCDKSELNKHEKEYE